MAWQLRPIFFLERFCPIKSMAPVLAIVRMVAGVVLKKENGPTPMGRLNCFSPTGPGHVEFSMERLA